jgi:hypothetical protein
LHVIENHVVTHEVFGDIGFECRRMDGNIVLIFKTKTSLGVVVEVDAATARNCRAALDNALEPYGSSIGPDELKATVLDDLRQFEATHRQGISNRD